MRVFVFLASGILEDGSVAFFHMNLEVFLKQNCISNESVCFFGFRHSGRRFRGLFSYEFISFFWNRIVFFNEDVCFFGFRHFGRRFRGVFSYEFISFFGAELFFLMRVFVFLFQAFWKTVLWLFHMNS